MAKTDPVTTYCQAVVATNAAYGGANKVTFPFKADKVTVSIYAASGNPTLSLSLDGSTDAALLHDTGNANTYTFTLQEIDVLHYKQSGTDCHFIVNAETKAWRNMF